ncbi:e3 ubiquitin-protein ligase rnf213-alpha [Anaeramoeba flamelloides]|uniref:E3 ubiquitin-protein ligase rnf213-alpha n=1 Tax=Anaeramoeba flamelloides TaxID=1746091 RepID=A0ABQ8YPD5_9EUKA|nr:e3 ubiquitin-protein ligase rnf213-alpha [Anaeramoeba flamelloides]
MIINLFRIIQNEINSVINPDEKNNMFAFDQTQYKVNDFVVCKNTKMIFLENDIIQFNNNQSQLKNKNKMSKNIDKIPNKPKNTQKFSFYKCPSCKENYNFIDQHFNKATKKRIKHEFSKREIIFNKSNIFLEEFGKSLFDMILFFNELNENTKSKKYLTEFFKIYLENSITNQSQKKDQITRKKFCCVIIRHIINSKKSHQNSQKLVKSLINSIIEQKHKYFKDVLGVILSIIEDHLMRKHQNGNLIQKENKSNHNDNNNMNKNKNNNKNNNNNNETEIEIEIEMETDNETEIENINKNNNNIISSTGEIKNFKNLTTLKKIKDFSKLRILLTTKPEEIKKFDDILIKNQQLLLFVCKYYYKKGGKQYLFDKIKTHFTEKLKNYNLIQDFLSNSSPDSFVFDVDLDQEFTLVDVFQFVIVQNRKSNLKQYTSFYHKKKNILKLIYQNLSRFSTKVDNINIFRMALHTSEFIIKTRIEPFYSILQLYNTHSKNTIDRLKKCFFPSNISSYFINDFQNNMNHYWVCPNGHPYYVGECGRPTATNKCKICQANIGGHNHQELKGCRRATINDFQEPTGYSISDIIEKNLVEKFRNLSSISFRFLRLLLHLSILPGLLLDNNNNTVNHYFDNFCRIINKNFEKPKNKKSLLDKIIRHINNDLETLSKLLSIPIEQSSWYYHILLNRLKNPKTNNINKFQAINLFYKKKNGRNEFENEITDFVNAKQTIILDSIKEIEKKNSQQCQLMLDILNPNITKSWKYQFFENIDLDSFIVKYENSKDSLKKFKFINFYLKNWKTLHSLSLFQSSQLFLNSLINKYNGLINQTEARGITIKQFFKELKKTKNLDYYQRIQNGWIDLKTIWNFTFKNVKNLLNCQGTPLQFQKMVINESLPISFLLPMELDEHFCIIGLVTNLIDSHNDYIKKIKKFQKFENLGKKRILFNTKYYNQFNFNVFLNLNKNIFLDFIKDHYSKNTNLYFKLINDFLINFLTSYKGEHIELKMDNFVFRGSTLTDFQIFNSPIWKQKDISKNDSKILTKDLKKETALIKVKTVVEIIMTNLEGISLINVNTTQLPDQNLINFALHNLKLDKKFQQIGNISKTLNQLQLAHLLSLHKLLVNTLIDPIEAISTRFKTKLSHIQEKELLKAIKKLNNQILLQHWKRLIFETIDDNTPSKSALKEFLQYLMEGEDLLAQDSISKHFPSSILMEHSVTAYQFYLKNLN